MHSKDASLVLSVRKMYHYAYIMYLIDTWEDKINWNIIMVAMYEKTISGNNIQLAMKLIVRRQHLNNLFIYSKIIYSF